MVRQPIVPWVKNQAAERWPYAAPLMAPLSARQSGKLDNCVFGLPTGFQGTLKSCKNFDAIKGPLKSSGKAIRTIIRFAKLACA